MKPILFNTDMVRAILDNRKTVTRRIVKPQPICHGPNITYGPHTDDFFLSKEKNWLRCRVCGYDPEYSREGSNVAHHWTPPYRPGDILYVRETWKQATCDYAGGGYGLTDLYLYKADEPIDTSGMMVEEKWHPSIHMPREAARIFLRVTDVRVERLQDITEEQAIAEGCSGEFVGDGGSIGSGWNATPQEELEKIWDNTIKPKDRALYGWESNPWVFVISFERISREEASAHD